MKQLGQANIGTGVTLYTVPSGYATDVFDINIANTTAAARTVSLYLVPSGGSKGTARALLPGVTVPAKTLVQWTGVQALLAGGFIYAEADVTGVTVTVTGDERRVGL